MLKNVTLGTYYEGSSPLHRLQARTKLIGLVGIAIWLMEANRHRWHFAPILTALTLLIMSIALSRLPLRLLWQRLRLLIIFTLIGSVPTLFTRENDNIPFATLGPLHLPYGTLEEIATILALLAVLLFLISIIPVASLRTITRPLKRSRVLLLLVLIATSVYLWYMNGTSSSTLIPLGPFTITAQGVWIVSDIYVSLLTLLTFSILVTMTTTPVALIEGLTLLLAPLRRLRLPVDDFALMALLALRFIPTLSEEVEQLMKAQAARGADMNSGPMRGRIQSLMMLFVPLMRAIFRRASELGTALEARGYEIDGKQTMLYETSLKLVDYAVLVMLAGVIVGTLLM